MFRPECEEESWTCGGRISGDGEGSFPGEVVAESREMGSVRRLPGFFLKTSRGRQDSSYFTKAWGSHPPRSISEGRWSYDLVLDRVFQPFIVALKLRSTLVAVSIVSGEIGESHNGLHDVFEWIKWREKR